MSKVLVVADADWVVNDIHASLGVGDWSVEVVADPKASVAAVTEHHPDVVVVDLQVGSMGGMAVVREIRAAHEGGGRPRLVMLLDRRADVFLAGRAGADAWVLKPFEAQELRAALGG